MSTYISGVLQSTRTIAAPGASVSTALSEGSLTSSWNVIIPAAEVQPGAQILADVDPTNAIAEGNEGDNIYPASGTPAALDVRTIPTFYVTLVPVVQSANGLTGDVSVGNQDSFLNSTRKMWPFSTVAPVIHTPYTTTTPGALAADGTIYFGSWDKSLYALNADGSRKWQFATLGPVSSSPAIGLDGTIYFGSHDTNFYAVAADGRRRWEFATGGQIVSSPALNKSECLYFTSQDGFLYALNLDGKLRWKLQTGGMTQCSPVLGADGTIYLGVNEHMWAILPEGNRKWEQPTTFTDPFEASALVLADGTICHVSRYGMLMDFDTEQFGLKWMYSLGQQGYASPAIGAKGRIFAASQFANFVALRTTVPLARTPWPKFRGNPRNTGNASDW